MAGDWIKMKHDLIDDEAVSGIAQECGITDAEVIGRLFMVWSWFDRHTTDGRAKGVTCAFVDGVARRAGFAQAMKKFRWLSVTKRFISLPNYCENFSQTAKARALTSKRVALHRKKTCNAHALPEQSRAEQSRAEERRVTDSAAGTVTPRSRGGPSGNGHKGASKNDPALPANLPAGSPEADGRARLAVYRALAALGIDDDGFARLIVTEAAGRLERVLEIIAQVAAKKPRPRNPGGLLRTLLREEGLIPR